MTPYLESMRLAIRRKVKTALILFLPLIFLTAISLVMLYRKDLKPLQHDLSLQSTQAVALQKNIIDSYFGRISTDLLFLADHVHFQEMFALPVMQPEAFTQDLRLFSQISRIYDQVRVLDATGMELIRINFSNNAPLVVPQDQLQFKGDHYYFQETFALQKGEIYLSPLDLNIEHGQIELPRKPMLRIGTPAFDKAGHKRGIIVFNYLAGNLLHKLKEQPSASPGQSMLLNREGYWFVGRNADEEWGFMYENGQQQTMAHKYPDAWPTISTAETGQFLNRAGLFTFATVHPWATLMGQNSVTQGAATVEGSKPRTVTSWKIVSFIPLEIFQAQQTVLRNKYGIIFSVLLMLLAAASWLAAELDFAKRQKEESLRRYGEELANEVRKRTTELVMNTRVLQHELAERKKTERALRESEQEIQRINQELRILNRVIIDCATTLEIEELLNKVLDEALTITGLEGGTFCFVTPEETLQLAAHRATSEATIVDLTSQVIKVGDCLCGQCASDHKPLILADREAVLKYATREATRHEDIRFHAAFPLVTGERCLGVLCVFTRTDIKPEARKLQLLETICTQVALAMANARLYAEQIQQNLELDEKVRLRTLALEKKNRELEKFNKLFVDREFRINELKEQLKKLEMQKQQN